MKEKMKIKALLSSCVFLFSLQTQAAYVGSQLSVEKESTGQAKARLVSVATDIESGATFTAGESEWIELLLIDGTSVLLTPNTSLVLNEFSFDETTGDRSVQFSIEGGKVRVVDSGKSDDPILIQSEFGQTSIQKGAALINQTDTGGTVLMLWGEQVNVTGKDGQGSNITTPGYQVLVSGEGVGEARRLSGDEMAESLASLTPQKGTVVETWTNDEEFSDSGSTASVTGELALNDDALLNDALADSNEFNESLNDGSNDGGGGDPVDPPDLPTGFGIGDGFAIGSSGDVAVADATSSVNGQQFVEPFQLGTTVQNYNDGDPVPPPVPVVFSVDEEAVLQRYQFHVWEKREPVGSTDGVPSNVDSGGSTIIRDLTEGSGGWSHDRMAQIFVTQAGDTQPARFVINDIDGYDQDIRFDDLGDGTRGGELLNDGIDVIAPIPTIDSSFNFVPLEISDFSSGGIIRGHRDDGSPADGFSSYTVIDDGANVLEVQRNFIGSAFFVTQFDANVPSNIQNIQHAFLIMDLLRDGGSNDRERSLIFGGTTNPNGMTLPDVGVSNTITTYSLTNSLDTLSGDLSSLSTATYAQTETSFRPENVFLSGARGDSGFLVVNRFDSSGNLITNGENAGGIFRSELQIGNDGSSNISLTVGHVNNSTGTPLIRGSMASSSRGSPQAGSTAMFSAIGSDGNGDGDDVSSNTDQGFLYGGHDLVVARDLNDDGVTDGVSGTGDRFDEVIHFVLSQDDALTRNVDNDTRESVEAATISPIGNLAGETDYAFTRIAAATDAVQRSDVLSACESFSCSGFASALAESADEDSVNAVYIAEASNVSVSTDRFSNSVEASFNVDEVALNTLETTTSDLVNLTFGDVAANSELSTYIDSNRYGAVTADKKAGFVSGKDAVLLAGVQTADPLRADLQYAQWGFWFGDILVETAQGFRRDHVHLGTWVAGNIVDLDNASGTASYSGHVIGNVIDPGGLRDAVGNFDATYDFSNGSGTINNFNFDGNQFVNTGISRNAGTNTFSGQNSVAGGQAGQNRNLAVDGAFYGNSAVQSDIGGQFKINQTEGPDFYNAAGTFVGGQ